MNVIGARKFRRCAWIPLVPLVLAVPLQARALQPLETFIRSARQHSPDNAEARANLTQQQAQADVALGRVLPGVTARGNYYRNQYQSSVSVPIDPAAPPQTIAASSAASSSNPRGRPILTSTAVEVFSPDNG